MNSLVGFTLLMGLLEDSINAVEIAQANVLSYFDRIRHKSIQVGETRLELWGRAELTDCIHTMPDASVLVLIGSPVGEISWRDITKSLLTIEHPEEFELPWEGRVILLKISADGRRWTLWNDWLGSIPVFHTAIGKGRIASTLEPVTVAAAGFSAEDFFMPGLVSLLINGHFLSDWTLFKGLKTVPPDCVAEWTEDGFRSNQLWAVQPTDARWETGWDDLVDEMHKLSHRAIAEVLKTRSTWILPLSSGLDSRLIAAVGADLGVDLYAYAWGEPNSTDVVYSRQIARKLGYPWKHIDLPKDFLVRYTPQWADMFGSSMHFHGMYQMAFLDAIKSESSDAIVTGFIGDVLSGSSLMQCDAGSIIYKQNWYEHWTIQEAKALLKVSIDDALQEIVGEVKSQMGLLKGARFPKALFFELWSRQRLFTNFQSTLSDYWRGTATPFLNRKYARFCMSLPRVALENRRLLGDVYRRYYGRLAVIPGTYANEPYIRTGRYLAKRRIAHLLPASLRRGPFAGLDQVSLRMDMESIRVTGKASLWPIYDVGDQLSEWLDVGQLELAYQAVMSSIEDSRPLRKLQSVQTLAYRLLKA